MQSFDVKGGLRLCRLVLFIENLLRTSKKIVAPDLDLVGMHIKLLRQLTQGLLPLDRFNRNFGFESRRVIAPWSSCHFRSPVIGNHAGLQAINPLIAAVQISRATSI